MIVTEQQLLAIMPTAKNRIPKYIGYINTYAKEFGITTPMQMAMFIAQVAHESGELRYTEELSSGEAYEGRRDLGNVYKGDGVRFKGRGLLQLSGRANYKLYKEYCGFDVVAKPYLLAQPLGATRSAFWFFCKYKKLQALSEVGNLKEVTKRINGGYNGLKSREMYYNRAKKALNIKK